MDVNLTEHSTVITFSNYHDGAAPFLLINHTKEEIIEYGQRYVRRVLVWMSAWRHVNCYFTYYKHAYFLRSLFFKTWLSNFVRVPKMSCFVNQRE